LTGIAGGARDNKRRFRLFQIITLIASAIIPIINLGIIDTVDYQIRIISSIVSAIIVVITGLTQLEKKDI